MTFHETMLHDHEQLDGMLGAMLDAAAAGDREELSRRWDAFELVLLAHMNGEEVFMLPALAKHDAKRAAAIQTDHAAIRELLAAIAIGLDLHMVNEERIRALRQRLDTHARGEEVDFYRWADETLPETTLASVRRRIGAQLKATAARAV